PSSIAMATAHDAPAAAPARRASAPTQRGPTPPRPIAAHLRHARTHRLRHSPRHPSGFSPAPPTPPRRHPFGHPPRASPLSPVLLEHGVGAVAGFDDALRKRKKTGQVQLISLVYPGR